MWVVAKVERGCNVSYDLNRVGLLLNRDICRDMGTCLFGGFVWYGRTPVALVG